jgi:hypothetical protein
VLTAVTPNTNLTDLTLSGTGAAASSIAITTQGFNGVVTAAEVATAMGSAGATIAGKLTVGGALTGFTASTSTNNTVTFTSSTAGSPVTDISATSTGNQPTVVTTQGVTGVTESASIVFSALKSGQSVSVDGLILTATGGDLTAAQVAEALDGDTTGHSGGLATLATAVLSGALTGYSAGAIASGSTVVYTSTTASTDVTNINNATNLTGAGAANTIGVGPATAPTAPAVTATDGGVGATAGGILALTNMPANGTLELTGVITGASSVALANSSGSTDVLNIKLYGAANLVNTAALTVANVETINITATDSSSDTTALTNPAAASTILLNAANATALTVTGNHGVNFTGSTLTNVVSLDASGVVSLGNAAGATAAQIGTTGAVTFTSVINNKAVTVTTGNGADVIDVSSVNDATFLATNVTAATVTTGEGTDSITGSAGKDVINSGAGADTVTGGLKADTITLGAGNDLVKYTAAAQSTLADKDVITDFSANTFGNGTSGAAGTGAAIASQTSFTGDVIDLRSFIVGAITKVSVAVVASEASATISLQNVGDATTDTIAAAIDSTTGNLYLDINSDGVADSVIQLSGVSTLTNAAFLVA